MPLCIKAKRQCKQFLGGAAPSLMKFISDDLLSTYIKPTYRYIEADLDNGGVSLHCLWHRDLKAANASAWMI